MRSRPPSQDAMSQWPLAGGSPLTVARQLRIWHRIPAPSELFSCRRPLCALRNTRLVERRHVIQEAHGGAHQGQREHRAGALTEAEVEVEQRMQAEPFENRAMPDLLRAVRCDEVA